MRRFRLKVDLPYLPKGAIYDFDDETACVYRVVDKITNEIPLRNGLAGYLWLLLTDRHIYFLQLPYE